MTPSVSAQPFAPAKSFVRPLSFRAIRIEESPYREPIPRQLNERHGLRSSLAVERAIAQHATLDAISPALIQAVVRAESAGNPEAVSAKGAVGLMQLMPETGMRFGVLPHQRTDPQKSLIGGSRYLAWLRKYFDGDLVKTIAAYNCGEGCVSRRGLAGIPRETKAYVHRVLSLLERQ